MTEMPNTDDPVSQPPGSTPSEMFPVLTSAQQARVLAHGQRRIAEQGEIVVELNQQVPGIDCSRRTPNIELHTNTEVVALAGNDHLERVTWRNNLTGQTESRNIAHLFSMTGAVPNSAWLDGCVACDQAGFIQTGSDLTTEDLAKAKWPIKRPPYLLETSLPGVFAVGDIRAGNVKRVASAVGEGSIVVSFVHQVLSQ